VAFGHRALLWPRFEKGILFYYFFFSRKTTFSAEDDIFGEDDFFLADSGPPTQSHQLSS
jgi:hypothetical protein